jgi:hypothetical protein
MVGWLHYCWPEVRLKHHRGRAWYKKAAHLMVARRHGTGRSHAQDMSLKGASPVDLVPSITSHLLVSITSQQCHQILNPSVDNSLMKSEPS